MIAFASSPQRCDLISRRRALLRLTAVAIGSAGGCRKQASSTIGSSTGTTIELRDRPLPMETYPLANARSFPAARLLEAARVAFPSTTLPRYPLGYLMHSFRLWGVKAGFPKLPFVRSDLRGAWGARCLDALTDDPSYHSLVKHELPHLLTKGRLGVQVHTTIDGNWGDYYGSPHVGKYVHVMADCGIPITQELVLADDARYQLRDAILEDAASIHSMLELEWFASGLSRYLISRSWRNRFNQPMSFSSIASTLLDRQLNRAACLGCHIPYALASLLNVDRRVAILEASVRARLLSRVRDYAAALEACQAPDGSWGYEWVESQSPGPRGPDAPWKTTLFERIAITGHLLEYSALLPQDLRAGDESLLSALHFLVTSVAALHAYVDTDWHLYAPVTHGVRGALLLMGCPADATYAFVERGGAA